MAASIGPVACFSPHCKGSKMHRYTKTPNGEAQICSAPMSQFFPLFFSFFPRCFITMYFGGQSREKLTFWQNIYFILYMPDTSFVK